MPSDENHQHRPFAGVRFASELDEPASVEDTARMFERVVDAITSAGRAVESVSKLQDDCFAELERQRQELVQLRSFLVALDNRIETLTRSILAMRAQPS